MKRILSAMAAVALTSGIALAQNGPGPGGSTNDYDHSWSNYVQNSYGYMWGTDSLAFTNVPQSWSNRLSHSYAGKAQEGGGGQVRSGFGTTDLPTDVQTIVRQFQQDRTRLMSQLKDCSDEQRQQVLQEMEQLRTQLRDRMGKVREDARQQAEQMRNRFGNNRDRILDQGAGNTGTGRDR